jgi:hypothetical protein
MTGDHILENLWLSFIYANSAIAQLIIVIITWKILVSVVVVVVVFSLLDAYSISIVITVINKSGLKLLFFYGHLTR